MGDSNSKIEKEDLINNKYKCIGKILVPNCGSLPILEFEKDPSTSYILKVQDQKRWEDRNYNKDMLNNRLNDKTKNVVEIILVSVCSKNCSKYEMVFEHSTKSLDSRIQDGP